MSTSVTKLRSILISDTGSERRYVSDEYPTPKLIDPAPVTEQRPPYPPIMLNAYRALDGSEAAIIANATDEKQIASFQWQQETRTLQMAPWTMRLVK